MAHFNNLAQVWITTSKTILDIYHNKLGTRVASRIAEGTKTDERLRKLGILEKCQIWVETQPSAQSHLQKLNVDSRCQKTQKNRYYICEILSNFTAFLCLMPNTLSRIVCLSNQTFGRNFPQCPSHLKFCTFSVISKYLSNHDKNINQVSCVKSFRFHSFVLALFCILGLG